MHFVNYELDANWSHGTLTLATLKIVSVEMWVKGPVCYLYNMNNSSGDFII